MSAGEIIGAVNPPTMPDAPKVPSVHLAELPDDAILLDVREPQEWAAGHAPGAVHIPLADLPGRLHELPQRGEGDGPLAVTCRSGGRASRAVAWLASQGIDAVNLDGGMKAWESAGRPLVAAPGTSPTIR